MDGMITREVEVAVDGLRLPGELSLPDAACGVALFAHGSGSSRLSPRNVQVARALNQRGLGSLLFDLLTAEESIDRSLVFDIPFLAARLAGAAMWLRQDGGVLELPLGYFGASTGGGAALWASTEPDAPEVRAIVSRGGRPDLAGPRLAEVRAPTLLVVGGDDLQVLEMNREAQRELRCPNDLVVVWGATHLFEEPGALEEVARLAAEWFLRHLPEERP